MKTAEGIESFGRFFTFMRLTSTMSSSDMIAI